MPRNIQPEIQRLKGRLAGLSSRGASQAQLDEARRELEQAKLVAAIEAICTGPIALTPEQFVRVVKALTEAMGRPDTAAR